VGNPPMVEYFKVKIFLFYAYFPYSQQNFCFLSKKYVFLLLLLGYNGLITIIFGG